MSEKMDNNVQVTESEEKKEYSLNDDRRVKVLSPGAMVAKRFFRNRIAVVGMVTLIIMFLFSFVGGMLSPYSEKEQFYRYDTQRKDYAGAVLNDEYRYMTLEGADFSSAAQAKMLLAMQKGEPTFKYGDKVYRIQQEGADFYSAWSKMGNEMLCIAYKDVVSPANPGQKLSFYETYAILFMQSHGESTYHLDDTVLQLDEEGGVSVNGEPFAFVSRYVVQPIMPDVFLTRDFKEQLVASIEDGNEEFVFTDENGESHEYTVVYDAAAKNWSIKQEVQTMIFDTYGHPSKEHPLGTDRNGMDMLTRLMYGGRVSLIIGFIVVIIETVIGVIMGGLAGYFGKWVDNLIMRMVDVFYCIPSMPIIIILGAAMDNMKVDPTIRMVYLMLILGFLGWPGIARMVRGQILSLREQEFMTATEACGIRVSQRIFKHLIPNVIPQLIVVCTMGLGSTILTEATLSFLGLGVKFPFASWGNIINDVNDTFVLTNYWFIWIPAGVCLLLTVLAFNLVGDGLRDAFDPKMKR